MSNELTPQLSFETKLKNKIKESIGELVSEEDLSKLVKASLEDVFTKPRPNPKYNNSAYSYNNNEPKTIEPFLHELIKELLQPTFTEEVQKYIKENPAIITDIIKPIIQEGAGKAILSAVSTMLAADMRTMEMNILNRLVSAR